MISMSLSVGGGVCFITSARVGRKTAEIHEKVTIHRDYVFVIVRTKEMWCRLTSTTVQAANDTLHVGPHEKAFVVHTRIQTVSVDYYKVYDIFILQCFSSLVQLELN